MERKSYDCSMINTPRTIVGVDWSIFFAVVFFFTMAIVETHVYWLAVIPVTFIFLLRDPCRRDPMLLAVYRRHRGQHHHYSAFPAGVRTIGKMARPIGFNRLEQVF